MTAHLHSMLALSKIDHFFQISTRGSSFRREVIGGVTSFLTMAYAFLLIPNLFASTGIDFSSCVTATVIVAFYSTMLMGLFANYPIVVAPGVTIVVYLTYGILQPKGFVWETALALSFFSGVALWVLNITRVRALIIQTVPFTLRICTTAGLGLFFAMIGLKNGGMLNHEGGVFSLGDPTRFGLIMVAVGLIITALLLILRLPGSYFIAIVIVWIISALFGKADVSELVSWPHSLVPTLFKLDVHEVWHYEMLTPVLSLLFVLLFDSTGTVIALVHKAGLVDNKEKECKIPRIVRLFTCDSTGSMLSGILGTVPTSNYLESAAGIASGARTGLASLVTALFFVLMLFFTPMILSIPLYATSAALIIIGGSMLSQLVHLKWRDVTEWIPGFCTLLIIPLTFNVALGIGIGYVVYLVLKLLTGRVREVHWFSWIMGVLFITWLILLVL